MSNALSNQLVAHDGADYEEVYPSSHKDQESPSEERSPSASSPSSTNEDMEMVELEEGSDDGKEQPYQWILHIKLLSIVRNQHNRYPVPVDNILPDKTSNIFLRDSS